MALGISSSIRSPAALVAAVLAAVSQAKGLPWLGHCFFGPPVQAQNTICDGWLPGLPPSPATCPWRKRRREPALLLFFWQDAEMGGKPLKRVRPWSRCSGRPSSPSEQATLKRCFSRCSAAQRLFHQASTRTSCDATGFWCKTLACALMPCRARVPHPSHRPRAS